MKKLQNLKGAKALNKKEQQSIQGGADCISPGSLYSTYEECDSNCAETCIAYLCHWVIMGYHCPPPQEQ